MLGRRADCVHVGGLYRSGRLTVCCDTPAILCWHRLGFYLQIVLFLLLPLLLPAQCCDCCCARPPLQPPVDLSGSTFALK